MTNKGDFYTINYITMVSNTSIEITPSRTVIQKEVPADYSALLLLPVAVVAAHQYSKKQMRKLGRKMIWQLMKLKLKSMFSFKGKNGTGPSCFRDSRCYNLEFWLGSFNFCCLDGI